MKKEKREKIRIYIPRGNEMYRKGGERDPFQLNQVNILYGLLLFLKIAHVT